jgi:iron(III) transport system substrate-binding protein
LENAEKLIAFLLSEDIQRLYAELNYEFPILDDVPPSDLVASWGELHPDPASLTVIAGLQDGASALVDELQFDGGPQN